jgi:predicted aldo/keto reductase-like oxidoreductase
MKYRKGCGEDRISALAFGCMRLTKKGGAIDMEKAERELLLAIDGGVNYFDTAYFYRGSEKALGTILRSHGCRDKVFIADKLPQFYVRGAGDFDRYLKESLDRLQTEYIDYYMLHMLTDRAGFEKLLALGLDDWIRRRKEEGRIRYIGFSFHGNSASFLDILEAYPWDFCQIQYNYMDEESQAGRKGLLAAAAKGMPVIVMEPLRGGRLVTALPQNVLTAMKEHPRGWSPVEWSFHWLWDQPEVTCVLSGMNSEGMIIENLRAADASDVGCLTDSDRKFLAWVRDEIQRTTLVPCTGCGYCMPCPFGVDIPAAFRCYNLKATEGARTARLEYTKTTAFRMEGGPASLCTSCGACVPCCPQGIDIPTELKGAVRYLETPSYKMATAGYRFLNRLRKPGKQAKRGKSAKQTKRGYPND